MPEHSNDDFAARAERLRRAGDPDSALKVARGGLAGDARNTAGRVAAGLALLDLGRVAEARAELEAVVHVAELEGPLLDLAEDELDSAFETAAPEHDEMLDAEGIAMQAVTSVERDDASLGPELPGEAFRTHAMAQLLEQQGDLAGAEAIRESMRGDSARPTGATGTTLEAEPLVGKAVSPTPTSSADAEAGARAESGEVPRAPRARRRTRVEVLERWLHNVRRGQG